MERFGKWRTAQAGIESLLMHPTRAKPTRRRNCLISSKKKVRMVCFVKVDEVRRELHTRPLRGGCLL
jgi:hypothetical protein